MSTRLPSISIRWQYTAWVDPAVGELFILGFRGTTAPAWLQDFENRFGLGGVILFDYDVETRRRDRNVESLEQLRDLCAELHAFPSRPLIFVDQEGGAVRRLREKCGFAPLPSAEEFQRLSEQEMRAVAARSFGEQAELGIDFDLAPVVDLNSNPQNPDIGARGRSYSPDPDVVEAIVRLLAEEARRVGLGLCLKHYPGLGGATTNSHEDLTRLTGTLCDEQLRLFFELAGTIPGEAVLLSHGIVDEWDPDEPVSMSRVAAHALREKLPDALLLTDDIQMQGLQLRYGTTAAVLRAVGAGLDLVIVGNNLLAQERECFAAAEALQAALEKPAFAASARASARRVQARKLGSRSLPPGPDSR